MNKIQLTGIGIPRKFTGHFLLKNCPCSKRCRSAFDRFLKQSTKESFSRGLYVYGKKGTGKTCLGTFMLKWVICAGKSAQYMTHDYLVDFAFSERRTDFEKELLAADVTMIDNIDRPSVKGEGYYPVLQRGMQIRADAGLATVLVCDMTVNEFADRFGESAGNLLKRFYFCLCTEASSQTGFEYQDTTESGSSDKTERREGEL